MARFAKNFVVILHHQTTTVHCWTWLQLLAIDLWLLASSSHQVSCVNRHIWPEGILRVYRDAVSTLELVYPSGYRFDG
jgi:hypothetical protein